jgi:hypothetical protein
MLIMFHFQDFSGVLRNKNIKFVSLPIYLNTG